LSKQIILFANFEIDKRSDSGSNFVANDIGTTSTNRVLATDLMRVSTELGNLGYNTGAYQGFAHSNSNKGIVKFDWNINDNNKLAVIYISLMHQKINCTSKCFRF
jgi:hypothetical protein